MIMETENLSVLAIKTFGGSTNLIKNICKMEVLDRGVIKRNAAMTALKQATKLHFHRKLIFYKMQGYLSAILSRKKKSL